MSVGASDPDLADRVATRLLDARARAGRIRVLAVDGPAGAGKSTLADSIAARLTARGSTVALIRLDDMYDGWGGLTDELSCRVIDQVLRPLAEGHHARWQAYDWTAGRFDEWHEVAPPDVLILEGCGGGALPHAPYLSMLVYIDAPPQTRLSRAVARDGEPLREHWDAWTRQEDRHFAAHATRERADLSVRT